MKLFPKALAASVVALAFASTASAQVKIYITGSTAFRSSSNAAIQAALSGPVVVASTNATLGSANAVTFTGGNIGGVAVTVKYAGIGSAGGVQAVAGTLTTGPRAGQQFQTRYLPDGASGTSNADPTIAGNPAELAVADIAFSDVYQVTTPFRAGANIATTPDASSYQNLVDTLVGVVTFRWTASNGFPASQTMTSQIARYLYSSSLGIPLAVITGLAADETRVVFGTGRNFDSGTRLATVTESSIGTAASLQQWKPTISGGNVTSQELYPINPNVGGLGISSGSVGNDGEISGSTLRGFLNNTLLASAYDPDGLGFTGGFYIAYLGVSDSNSTIAAGTRPAVAMKWNGTDFSQTAVMNGQYTFWSYIHLMHRSTLGNGTTGGPAVKLQLANTLKTSISNSTSAALNPNVSINDMRVSRPGDGGLVGATYF